MKKLFTLMVMALVAMSVNAKEVLTLPDGMGANVTTAFNSWEWKDVAKLYTGADVASDASDAGVVYYDASAYDYLVIKYKECTVKTSFGVQYNSKGTVGQWGAEFYASSGEIAANTSGILGVKLDADHKNKVYKVYLQSQGEGSLVVEEVYFGSTAEYEADLAANPVTPYVAPTMALNLANATNKWGEATYDAETHTATIDKDNGASGWWVNGISGYDYLVLEILDLQKVGYAQLQQLPDGAISLDEGSFVKVIDISKMNLTSGFSLVIQGGAGTTWKWQAAYFATAEYVQKNNIKDGPIYGDIQNIALGGLNPWKDGETARATFDATTGVLTITDPTDGGASWWQGSADYSHFDNFVVEFESTTAGGAVVVQYTAEEAAASRRANAQNKVEFGTGATNVVIPLNAAYKNAVQQMWIQGNSGASFTIKKAYVAVASATPEANLGTIESGETAKPVMISWGADDIAAAGKAKSSYGTGDFTMSITDTDGKVAVDANDCYFGDATTQTKFTHRLKSGGKSGSKLSFSLAIPSDGTLKVYARTGSNSATDRTLVLTQGGSELYNQVVKEADAVKVTGLDSDNPSKETNVYPIISVSAKKGDVVVTFPVGSMNFYGFEFVSGTTGIQQTIAPAKVIENNVIYNLAGQRVNENYKGIVIKNGKKYIQK